MVLVSVTDVAQPLKKAGAFLKDWMIWRVFNWVLSLEYYHCAGLFGSLRRSVAKFLMIGFSEARRAFVEVTVSGMRI